MWEAGGKGRGGRGGKEGKGIKTKLKRGGRRGGKKADLIDNKDGGMPRTARSGRFKRFNSPRSTMAEEVRDSFTNTDTNCFCGVFLLT